MCFIITIRAKRKDSAIRLSGIFAVVGIITTWRLPDRRTCDTVCRRQLRTIELLRVVRALCVVEKSVFDDDAEREGGGYKIATLKNRLKNIDV